MEFFYLFNCDIGSFKWCCKVSGVSFSWNKFLALTIERYDMMKDIVFHRNL